MIQFKNGHQLTFCNGSGALAFTGKGWWWEAPLRWTGLLDPHAFTVVAKTVTYLPVKENLSLLHPWTCVRLAKRDGLVGATNAVGLTNPGLPHWIAKQYPVAKKMGYQIAVSVKPSGLREAALMRICLKGIDLAYIEVNVSCPNHEAVEGLVPIMGQFSKIGTPIVMKLSESQVVPTVVTAVEPFVDAFHAINTIPWKDTFVDASPIEHYKHKLPGGVSGQHIKERALEAVRKLKEMTQKPIIGGGGIFCLEDVYAFQNAGADAFSIGTLFLVRPWMPNRIVKEYRQCAYCSHY